jgi:hypothetical protein
VSDSPVAFADRRLRAAISELLAAAEPADARPAERISALTEADDAGANFPT